MNKQELYGVARSLLLAGGVVAIVLGALGLLGVGVRGSVGLDLLRPLVGIVVGIVALAMMNQVRSEAVEVVLIILGLISGNAGGLLIVLAGVVGLVARNMAEAPAQPMAPAQTTT